MTNLEIELRLEAAGEADNILERGHDVVILEQIFPNIPFHDFPVFIFCKTNQVSSKYPSHIPALLVSDCTALNFVPRLIRSH